MPQTPTTPDVLELVADARRDVKRLNEASRRAAKSLARLEAAVLARIGIRYEEKEAQK